VTDLPRTGPATLLRNLGWDVGLPVVTYYALHFLGASDWMALLAGSLAAGTRIVWPAVRDRTLNLFASVMLATFLIGLALAFVSGDPRFLLLKGSIVTGSIALGFLVSTALGRPLTLAASQAWNPAHAAAIAAEYRDDPRVRRGHRTCSLVWGCGLLAEALIRIPLIYLLPISVMVGLSTALTVTAFVLLTAWMIGYLRRHRARGASASVPV
jgi:hypothetical protein